MSSREPGDQYRHRIGQGPGQGNAGWNWITHLFDCVHRLFHSSRASLLPVRAILLGYGLA